MIQGKYDFGDHVFIDSKYTYSQEDVIYHELAHHSITQGSLYGVLEIVLKQVGIWHSSDIKFALAELSNASLTTQEMTATYAQCLYYKLKGKKELSEFEHRLHKGDYYKKYCISGFDEIVHYEQYDLNGTSLLSAIAIMALNIDITIAEPNWQEPEQIRNLILGNQAQYHVDYRYRQLIKTLLQLIRQRETLTEEKILRMSGITCLERTHENITDMLHRLARQLSEQCGINNEKLLERFKSILAPKKELSGRPNLSEIEQRILPKLLNNEYVYPPTYDSNLNSMMNSVTVVLHDESFTNIGVGTESDKIDCLIFHHAAAGWRYPVTYKREETKKFLYKFQGEIIVFTEDYDEFKQSIPLPAGKRVFYRYDGKWSDFVTQIRSHNTPYVHMHSATPLVNCIFVINEDNEVFFTIQIKDVTSYIIEDIRKGKMIYANVSGDDQNIRDCFYLTETDWCRYENVIVSVINRCFMDFPEGFPTVGGRINLEG